MTFKPYRSALAALLSLAALSATAVVSRAQTPTLDSQESAFLTLINNYRSQNGAGPLQVSVALENSSTWMSNDMAAKNYFSHTDSLGRDPFTRMAAFGYPYSPAGENIAAGNSDAQSTFTQWQTACDPDASGACTYAHKQNMLNPSYVVIGIGRAYSASSTYGWYWTTDFGGYLDQTIPTGGGPGPGPTPSNPPTIAISSPTANATVSGVITISGTASDSQSVTSVKINNGANTLGTATGTTQWTYTLDTRTLSNGPLTLTAVATDSAGLQSSASVTVNVSNITQLGQATYSATLQAPECATTGAVCDSGTLLNSRGLISGTQEQHQPNTINSTCVDGMAGTYHVDESNDRIRVSSLDGQALAAGKTAQIDATVWAPLNFFGDSLDLYYAANANSPNWIYLTTLKPATSGAVTLSTTYTLPAGALQAIRASFRYGGTPTVCSTGPYDDHDDLAFTVVSSAPAGPSAPTGVQITSPATNSLQVSWGAPAGVTAIGYKLDVSTSSAFTSYVPGYQNLDVGNSLSYNVTGLQPSTTYYARVRAYDSTGNTSPNSATATGKTSASAPAPAAPVITSATTGSATVGSSFSYTITATNSPTRFNATGLPPGLSVNTSTGQISGTPTGSGNFAVSLSAANSTGTGTSSLNLTVSPAPLAAPVINSPSSASATAGSFFSYTITATNSPTRFNATGLPPGLNVNTSTGQISGTPTGSGNFAVSLSAANSTGTGTGSLNLAVAPAPLAAPVITSASNASGTAGSPFSYTITATNSPTRFNATGLPAGLTVNTSTGQISGVPTNSGNFGVSLSAANSTGTGTGSLTLNIAPAPSTQPQAPAAAYTATPVSGQAHTLTFDGTGSTGGSLTYAWNFGDHSTAYGAVVTHTFPAAGGYNVTLTVSNGLGSSYSRQLIYVQ